MEEGGGRGRGRGRGGVPVLPQGMWDALQSNAEKSHTGDTIESTAAVETKSNDQYDDARGEGPSIPMGFGRGRGGGRGDFGRGAGRGGRGPGGLERDVKGKDWECPSCTNVNWSWRTNCNKCNTGKPASALTEAENRDGAGRGFNERQDRMSAAAVEIDDEGFDDFGRRVKKDARADRRAKEEAALARMNEKYKHLLPTAVAATSGTSAVKEGEHCSSSATQHNSSSNGHSQGSSSSGAATSSATRSANDAASRSKDNFTGGGAGSKAYSNGDAPRSDRDVPPSRSQREDDRDRDRRPSDRDRDNHRDRDSGSSSAAAASARPSSSANNYGDSHGRDSRPPYQAPSSQQQQYSSARDGGRDGDHRDDFRRRDDGNHRDSRGGRDEGGRKCERSPDREEARYGGSSRQQQGESSRGGGGGGGGGGDGRYGGYNNNEGGGGRRREY